MIDGRKLSEQIRVMIKDKIADFNEINQAKYCEKPTLGYILVGNKPESALYVRLKTQACEEIGIDYKSIILEESEKVTEQEIIKNILALNNDPKISGIMVQLPLPKHINEEKVLSFISP